MFRGDCITVGTAVACLFDFEYIIKTVLLNGTNLQTGIHDSFKRPFMNGLFLNAVFDIWWLNFI